jgi:apolipoprotein N-acyltransferase
VSRLRLATVLGWTRRRPAAAQAAAAVVTGALLAAAFPGPDLGPVVFVALVPLLLAAESARARRAGALGYLAGLTFFGIHLLWIAEFLAWTGAVAWLAWGALVAVEALFLAAFFALVPATRRLGAWRLLVLPCCWAAIELARAHLPLGGFPWGMLALSQHGGGPLLPLARVVGASGLAAVIVAVNLAVAGLLRLLAAGGPWPARRLAAAATWPALAVGLACSGLLAPAPPPPSGPPLDLAVVQGGERGGHGLELGATTAAVFANHLRMTEALGSGADLVIWGEGSVDEDPLRSPERLAALARAATAAMAPLLFGATTVVDDHHLATDALEVGADGRLAGRYRKRRLVPFGEYVPWGSVLGRLVPATREGVPLDKLPGRRLRPLPVAGVPVGVLICWESAYQEDARQLARDGAALMVVLTNNASFGDGPGSRQHLATSQLRAVEEGRTVVHAAVTGISALVGPDGVARQRTGLYQEATIRAAVAPRSGLTVYARLGRVVEAGLVGVAVVGVLLVAVVGRRGPRSQRLVHSEHRTGSPPPTADEAQPAGESRPASASKEIVS